MRKDKTESSLIIIIDGIPQKKYSIAAISYENDFRLTLAEEEFVVVLSFGNRVVFWQYEEEECNLSRINKLCNLLGTKIRDNSIFHVKESSLIDKIVKDSGSFYNKQALYHYLIVATDHVLDIVSMDAIRIVKTKIDETSSVIL